MSASLFDDPKHYSSECMFDDVHTELSNFLDQAIESIDERFGYGYAKKNPQLVMAAVELQARSFLNAVQYKMRAHEASS